VNLAEQDFEGIRSEVDQESQEEEEASILKLSMKTLKNHYGLNPGKYRRPVRSIGYQLGMELSRVLSNESLKDIDSIVKELSSYWVKYGLGEMFWADRAEMKLAIQFCSDCIGRAYGAGYTICPFKEGLLEAILESKLGKKYRVTEVECCGTQESNCVFRIEQTNEVVDKSSNLCG
jgi:predicted hydrocarbon binding protein